MGIQLKEGEFVVAAYVFEDIHYAMTNMGIQWHRVHGTDNWLTVA